MKLYITCKDKSAQFEVDEYHVTKAKRLNRIALDRKGNYTSTGTVAQLTAWFEKSEADRAAAAANREAEDAAYMSAVRASGYERMSDAELAAERAKYNSDEVPDGLLKELSKRNPVHVAPQTPAQRAYDEARQRYEHGEMSREDFEDWVWS